MHTRPTLCQKPWKQTLSFFFKSCTGYFIVKVHHLASTETLQIHFLSQIKFYPRTRSLYHPQKNTNWCCRLPPCYSLLRNLDLPNFLCLITLVWNNTGQHRLVNTNLWRAMSWYLIFLHHHRLLEVRCYSSAFLFHVSLSCTALYRVWMCFPHLCAPNLPF